MKNLFYGIICCLIFAACDKTIPRPPAIPVDLSESNLLPLPVSMSVDSSSFAMDSLTSIFLEGDEAALMPVAAYLQSVLKPATGYDFLVKKKEEMPAYGNIILSLNTQNDTLGQEGYDMKITEDEINISANTAVGVFYGIQTLRQLLPLDIEKKTKQDVKWLVGTGTIRDFPNYEWRGAMLDVSRHFFEVAEVKKVIDYLAAYKMNRFHIHLADDQGWRIEIKSWPNLTAHGGKTEVGGGVGGFFTQEQYSEIVKYADDRFITVIPEIDMPGHVNAALSSYPVLNCNGKATKMRTDMRVGYSSLCIEKDTTYAFIRDVIGEVAALTTGKYFHIGGDEAQATKKKDYIYFIEKVQKIVADNDKIMMGWDDITAAKLNEGTIAQHWEKEKNARQAMAQNLKIVMSPAKKAYLDMKYDKESKHGLRWAGLIPVDTGYIWNPATYIDGIGKENILGVEAPLWAETISNLDEAEYLLFPRLPGYAEMNWTQDTLRTWDDYRVRLSKEKAKWDIWGVDYFPSKKLDRKTWKD